MGKKEVPEKQAPPEGGPSAPYSERVSESLEDEQVTTYPEEELESPRGVDQGPARQIPGSESSEDEEEKHDEELEVEELYSETRSVYLTASDFKIQAVARLPKKPNSTKRPLQESEKNAGESSRKIKKAKRVAFEEAAEKNKRSSIGPSNRRLWSEEDEVVILEGLMDSESFNMAIFYELMKKSLSVNVPKNKFKDKIRKLKRKYNKNVERGERADFSIPHERRCFELSKKIWGGGGHGSNDAVALPGEQSGKEEVGLGEGSKDLNVDEVGHFWAMHPCLKHSLSDLSMKEPLKSFIMKNMTRIGSEKAKALEKKWKELLVDESILYLNRVQLIGEQKKLVLDATKASKD